MRLRQQGTLLYFGAGFFARSAKSPAPPSVNPGVARIERNTWVPKKEA
jgi:hypothetical protein